MLELRALLDIGYIYANVYKVMRILYSSDSDRIPVRIHHFAEPGYGSECKYIAESGTMLLLNTSYPDPDPDQGFNKKLNDLQF
jgi:hypothetical protein